MPRRKNSALVRTASLIEKARAEAKNSVLVDNGDKVFRVAHWATIWRQRTQRGDVHPVYKAMNTLNYAVGNWATMNSTTVSTSCTRRWPGRSPYVNANIVDLKTGKPMLRPI